LFFSFFQNNFNPKNITPPAKKQEKICGDLTENLKRFL